MTFWNIAICSVYEISIERRCTSCYCIVSTWITSRETLIYLIAWSSIYQLAPRTSSCDIFELLIILRVRTGICGFKMPRLSFHLAFLWLLHRGCKDIVNEPGISELCWAAQAAVVINEFTKLVQNPGNDQGILWRQSFFVLGRINFSKSDGKHFCKHEGSFDAQHEIE